MGNGIYPAGRIAGTGTGWSAGRNPGSRRPSARRSRRPVDTERADSNEVTCEASRKGPYETITGRESLDPIVFGWLVGIIEGEGSFFLMKQEGRKTRAGFSISMTDRDTVARVAQLIGGKVHVEKPRESAHSRGWKQAYRTYLAGPRALQLALEVEPYLSKRRREKIQEIIDTVGVDDFLPLYSYGMVA